MSKRTRKTKTVTTTSSKIFNFIAPIPINIAQIQPNFDYTDRWAIFGYGPVAFSHNSDPDPTEPMIYFPDLSVQGRRTISNLSIQCSFSYCQTNPNTGKYECFYPNCSSYLMTIIMKNGTRLDQVALNLFNYSEQKLQDNLLIPDPEEPLNSIIFNRTGDCGYPVSNILDIQPLRTCNGNVEAPQYINQVFIPGPIELDEDDKIVVLVVIPTSYTFYQPYREQIVLLQGMCIPRYDINF